MFILGAPVSAAQGRRLLDRHLLFLFPRPSFPCSVPPPLTDISFLSLQLLPKDPKS